MHALFLWQRTLPSVTHTHTHSHKVWERISHSVWVSIQGEMGDGPQNNDTRHSIALLLQPQNHNFSSFYFYSSHNGTISILWSYPDGVNDTDHQASRVETLRNLWDSVSECLNFTNAWRHRFDSLSGQNINAEIRTFSKRSTPSSALITNQESETVYQLFSGGGGISLVVHGYECGLNGYSSSPIIKF